MSQMSSSHRDRRLLVLLVTEEQRGRPVEMREESGVVPKGGVFVVAYCRRTARVINLVAAVICMRARLCGFDLVKTDDGP